MASLLPTDALPYHVLSGNVADTENQGGEVPSAIRRGCRRLPLHLMRGSALLLLGTLSYLATFQQQLVQLASPTTLAGGGAWTPGQPGLWEDKAFEARMEFRMPYMNFVEDIYVHSDVPNGLMRLSYYSGANVFLVNKSGSSYELLPIVDTVNCLYTPDQTSLETVVPALKTFIDMGSWREVDLIDENGLYSIGFEFTLNTGAPFEHGSNETWTYYDHKTAAALAGKYTFIVNATAGGTPVNITFKGHNGFLVSSHYDEYSIVYKAFYHRVDGIDTSMFRPPRGMPCTSFANVHGPFRTGPSFAQSRPLAAMHDLAMAVPSSSSDARQRQVAQSLEQHIQKGKRADNLTLNERRHVAMRHFRWIQARNRRGLPYSLKVNHMVAWLPHERQRLNGRMKVKAKGVKPKELLLQDVEDDSLSSQELVSIRVPDHCGHVTGHYDGDKRISMDSDHPTWKFEHFQKAGEQEALPENLDLRKKGLVTPVKDQGTCGSCWSFGTMGTVEGQYAKATGKLTVLAEQQLVDCTWSADNIGCDGGNDYKALSWLIQENKGKFQPASEYGPYLSQDGFCHLRKTANIFTAGFLDVVPQVDKNFVRSTSVVGCSHVASMVHGGAAAAREAAQIDMMEFVLSAYGPASVSITASDDDFYYYGSGVYNDPGCSPTDLDHIVVLVGYGRDKKVGLSYWTIKNSWSSHWGEDGYVRIAQKGNVCGVLTDPVIAHLG